MVLLGLLELSRDRTAARMTRSSSIASWRASRSQLRGLVSRRLLDAVPAERLRPVQSDVRFLECRN